MKFPKMLVSLLIVGLMYSKCTNISLIKCIFFSIFINLEIKYLQKVVNSSAYTNYSVLLFLLDSKISSHFSLNCLGISQSCCVQIYNLDN